MPNSTISAPVAADPIDRLTLGASDAREDSQSVVTLNFLGQCSPYGCMAEE